MKTTLNIDDDVLEAARELAQREGRTAGQVLSALARRGLAQSAGRQGSHSHTRNGVPVLPSRGGVITVDQVQRLMDTEGE
jgi:hypothetical protein